VRQIWVGRDRGDVKKQASDQSDKDQTMHVQGSESNRRSGKQDKVNTKGETRTCSAALNWWWDLRSKEDLRAREGSEREMWGNFDRSETS